MIKIANEGNVGSIYLSQGDYQKAVLHFESGIEADPSSSSAHFNLAVVLTSKMNEHSKALKYCMGAIRLDPNSSKANHLMGNILQNLGRSEQAERFFLRADTLAKGNSSREEVETDKNSASLVDLLESNISFRNMKTGDSRDFNIEQISYTVSCLSTRPFIVLVDSFLTEDECRHIISTGRPNLTESYLIGSGSRQCGDDDGGAYRSSSNAWLPQDDILTTIKKRLSQLTGIPMSYLVQKCEDLQVVRYEEGGQFKVHHDSSNFQKRFITALLYLNTPSSAGEGVDDEEARRGDRAVRGGETWFPFGDGSGESIVSTEEAVAISLQDYSSSADSSNGDGEGLARRGISIEPRRGRMALFFNHNLDGTIDPLAVHAGLPVVWKESCTNVEKWVANYWIDLDEEFLIQCLQ